MKFIKRRQPVLVTFAPSGGKMATLEGTVHYMTGDALMTGSAGEHWPISRERFEVTYDPIPPLQLGKDGSYTKKPIPVEARQTERDEVITLVGLRGTLQAKAGDWIVTGPDGKQWVVAKAIFAETYEPASNNC